MKKLTALLFLILFLAACGTESVDKARWLTMNENDRILYVKTLLGAEQVKESKGGAPKRHPFPPQVYTAAISEFYNRGDMRTPAEIFEELAQKPGVPHSKSAPVSDDDEAPNPHATMTGMSTSGKP